jgi:hypothetical protein
MIRHRRYEKLIEFYKMKEWQMSGANQVRPRQASALSHEVQQPTFDHCGAIGHQCLRKSQSPSDRYKEDIIAI